MKRWNFKNIIVLLILALFMVLGGSCGNPQEPLAGSIEEQTKALLHDDMEQLVQKLQEHLEFINERSLFPMDMYGYFMDITEDGIPEFIWAHTDSGNSAELWFHAYSLTEHQNISVTHLGDWYGLYYEDEEESSVLFHATQLVARCFIDSTGQHYYFAYRRSGAVAPVVYYHKLWQDQDGWKVESGDVPLDKFELPKDKSYPLTLALCELDKDNHKDNINVALAKYFDLCNVH